MEPQDSHPNYEESRGVHDVWFLATGLFLLTCVTTFYCGVDIARDEGGVIHGGFWQAGLSYTLPLMAILLFHEFGHYLQSVRHRIPATPPFFIPAPPGIGLFGTMGAVIIQRGHMTGRRALFDVAVSGPLAGLLIALPIAWFGVDQSVVKVFSEDKAYSRFGDPLLLQAMVWMKHGPLPAGHDVELNPLLFAGWVGLFLTGLNLLPIGQLDGGHVAYALFGRRAHLFARIVWGVLVVTMIVTQYWAFAVMMALLALMGLRHPPTLNDHEPLGTGRTIVGWFALSLLFLTFTLRPIDFYVPEKPAENTVPAEISR